MHRESKRARATEAKCVALVGHGRMGSIWASLVGPSRLRCVVGRDASRAVEFGARYGAQGFADLGEALRDPHVTHVIIASPSDAHYEQVKACLLADRDVLCDKPLARYSGQVGDLFSLARERHCNLFVGFQRRNDAHFAALHERVAGKRVELVRIVSRDGPSDAPRSLFSIIYESMIHDIDMAFHLSGAQLVTQLEWLHSVRDVRAHCAALLRFNTGAIALLCYDQPSTYGYDQRAEVHTADGVFSVDNPPPLCVADHRPGKRDSVCASALPVSYADRYAAAYAVQLEQLLSGAAPQRDDRHYGVAHDCAARLLEIATNATPQPPFAPQSLAAVRPVASQHVTSGRAGVALFGCGRMGAIRSGKMARNARLDLRWVVDVRAEAASQLASAHAGCRWTVRGEEALRDPAVLGVWICSGTAEHLELIRAAAIAGKKFIYCEKPIALQRDEIEAAYRVCAEHQCALSCAWNRLFDPHFDALALGTAHGVDAAVTHNGDHPCPPVETLVALGSIFHDVLVHDIHQVVRANGAHVKPHRVLAMGTAFEPTLRAARVFDTAALLVQYDNGTIAAHTAQRRSACGYSQRVEFLTSTGELWSAGNPRTNAVQHFEGGGDRAVTLAPIAYTFADRYDVAYGAEVDHFAAQMLDGASAVSSLEESLLVARICDEAAAHAQRE